MHRIHRILVGAGFGMLLAALLLALGTGAAGASPGRGRFGSIATIGSTVPPNGDINPYGVAVVPRSMGNLVAGNILVSNFNAASNLQGTGTTVVQLTPRGTLTVFAQIDAAHLPGPCPGGVGLTTALVVLRTGWVIVGSLPTTNGMADTAKAGCLLILNSRGHVVETFSGKPINGPWDMTALDQGEEATLFVTNVLNGTVAGHGQVVNRGTVLRIGLDLSEGQSPEMTSEVIIGSKFAERTDPAALVVGPTGVGLGSNGALYVADNVGNRIAAIPNALHRMTSDGTGTTITSGGGLNAPLGLTVYTNGDILTVNAGDGNLVETAPQGQQVQVVTLDPAGAGTLFGLAVAPNNEGVYFVDDGTNTLDLLRA